MDKAAIGYRLHFETEFSEGLAKKTTSLMPKGLDRVFFVSDGSEAVDSCHHLRVNGRWLRTEPTRGELFPGFRPATDRHLALR
jgi:adenosylmethionine-8-amino-7-oxononanoate aminotransferase